MWPLRDTCIDGANDKVGLLVLDVPGSEWGHVTGACEGENGIFGSIRRGSMSLINLSWRILLEGFSIFLKLKYMFSCQDEFSRNFIFGFITVMTWYWVQICFPLQVKGWETPTPLNPLERANLNQSIVDWSSDSCQRVLLKKVWVRKI
jgi:hypothetical protein